MDKFLTITKPSTLRAPKNDDGSKTSATVRYSPNNVSEPDVKIAEGRQDAASRVEIKHSTAALTRYLLSTLSEKTNPITHSNIAQRTDHVYSAATGHQVSEGRGRQRYVEERDKKLTGQRGERGESGGVLRNVKVYINGYLRDTTDIEMKRIVMLAGGLVVANAAGATHILTSQQLSASKTHKILTSKSRKSVHVVHPEWVTDSIKAGKRQPERHYSVIKVMSTMDLKLA